MGENELVERVAELERQIKLLAHALERAENGRVPGDDGLGWEVLEGIDADDLRAFAKAATGSGVK